MYRVALVCEGPADRAILEAVLDYYFDDYEPLPVQLRNPAQTEHGFRFMPNTRSDGCRTPIPAPCRTLWPHKPESVVTLSGIAVRHAPESVEPLGSAREVDAG